MSELERRLQSGGVSPWSTAGRALARDLQQVRNEVWVALAKDEGLAEYTENEMHNTAALNRLRKMLTHGDQFLNELLAEQQLGYVLQSEEIKRGMFKPWKV